MFYQDARKIDPAGLPDFDLLYGGFPCQSFSISSNRRLGFADPRGTLFFELARLAEAKRPRYLLFENVANILGNDSGRTFATILRALDRIPGPVGQLRHRLRVLLRLRQPGRRTDREHLPALYRRFEGAAGDQRGIQRAFSCDRQGHRHRRWPCLAFAAVFRAAWVQAVERSDRGASALRRAGAWLRGGLGLPLGLRFGLGLLVLDGLHLFLELDALA